MDIEASRRTIRRQCSLVLVFVAVGVALGCATSIGAVSKHLPQIFSRDYQSTATLFVATQNGASVTEAYQNNLFSQERVVSYAELGTSEQVAARATAQLKAPISTSKLRSAITAKKIGKTVLLSVGVVDSNPERAQAYANAVANQLVQVIGELETSRRGGVPAAGAVVVDDANYPTEVLGWALWKRIALGAAVGLVLGAAVVVLVSMAGRRARDAAQHTDKSCVLGGLPDDPRRGQRSVVDLEEGGLYADRLREISANLRFAVSTTGAAPRIVAVTSSSAGEGRTTTAIDLATALADLGRSVVLVDGDLRNATVADRLIMTDAVREAAARRGLSTILAGNDTLAGCILTDVPVGGGRTISVLPAGPPVSRPAQLWATNAAAVLFEEVTRSFDYAIIDTPPLSQYADGAIIGSLADGAILLARIRQTKSSAFRQAVHNLTQANVTVIGTVVTFEPTGRWLMRREWIAGGDRHSGNAGAAESGSAGTASASERQHDQTKVLASTYDGRDSSRDSSPSTSDESS